MIGEVKKGILYFLTGILCFAVSAGCFFFFVFYSSVETPYGTDVSSGLYNRMLILLFGLAAALLFSGLFLVPYGVRKINSKKKGA